MSRAMLNAYADDFLIPHSGDSENRFHLIAKILGILIVLNVLDGLLTLFWVYTNRAVEANPFMAVLIDAHPVLFMGLKIALVHLGSIILLRNCHRSLARVCAVVACSFYGALIVYHTAMFYSVLS